MFEPVDKIVRLSSDLAQSPSQAEIVKDWLENYPAETMPDGVIVVYANESGGDPIAYIYPPEDGFVRVNSDGVDYYIPEDEVYPRSRPASRRVVEAASEAEEVSEEASVCEEHETSFQESLPPEEQVCDPERDLVGMQNSARRFVERFDPNVGAGICEMPEGEILESVDPRVYYVYGPDYEDEEIVTAERPAVVEERPPEVQPDDQNDQTGETVTTAAENEEVAESSDIIQPEIGESYSADFLEPETQTVVSAVQSEPAPMPVFTAGEVVVPVPVMYSETPATLSAMSVNPPEGQSFRTAMEPSFISAIIYQDLSPQTSVGFSDFLTPPSSSQSVGIAVKVDDADGQIPLDNAGQSQAGSGKVAAAADGLKSDGLKPDAVLRHDRGATKPSTGRERTAFNTASAEQVFHDANLDPAAIAAAAPQGAPFVQAPYASNGKTPVEQREQREQLVARTGRDDEGHGRGRHDEKNEQKRDEFWFEDTESEEPAYS